MRYKGYEAVVDFDEADRVLHGRTLGTRDVISFEADSAHEIERAFHEAVDDYIEQCAETGREPDRSFSGPADPADGAGLAPGRVPGSRPGGDEPERLDRRVPGVHGCRASEP